MKTITINPGTARNITSRYHKLMKVCSLFDSKVMFEANNNVVDIQSGRKLISTMKMDENVTLRISGDDESQAVILIRECIGY
ncbi:HPr family phosphocarrier protein [Endozoicomonas montiporae]|nr:HPr family phosphocarrier protein [Endozoicomonas montiporae]